LPVTQASVVQAFPSLQSGLVAHVVGSVLLHVPPEHVSVVAQLPSLQSAFVPQQPGKGA